MHTRKNLQSIQLQVGFTKVVRIGAGNISDITAKTGKTDRLTTFCLISGNLHLKELLQVFRNVDRFPFTLHRILDSTSKFPPKLVAYYAYILPRQRDASL